MPTLVAAIDARKATVGAKQFTDATNKMKAGATGAGRAIGGFDKSIGSLSGKVTKFLAPLAGLFSIFAAIRGVRASIGVISDFEKSLAQLAGVTGATGEQFKALTDTARELGATTQFSANQAAEGLLFLSRAGFSVEESIQALPATLDLALAGMLDLGEAADIASNILKAFQLDTLETVRVVDVLVNTANSANTNIRQLAEAMKFVAPAARALNISVEKAAAAIGVLGDAGIQGGMAGTNLRAVFAALASQTEKIEKALGGLGLTFSDVNIESNDLIKIFERLNKASLGFGAAVQIFGRRNATAALIISASVDRIKELTKANEEANGVARKNAALIEQTLSGAFKSLISVIQETILIFGESGLLKALKGIVQLATNVIRILIGMEDAVTRNSTVAKVLAGAIKALTVLLVAFVAVKVVAFLVAVKFGLILLGNTLLAAAAALQSFLIGIGITSGLIGVIAVAVVALVAAFVFLNTVWGDNIDTMKDLKRAIDGTKKSFNSLISLLEQKQILVKAKTPAEALIGTQKGLIKEIKRQIGFLNKERQDLATLLDETTAEGPGRRLFNFLSGEFETREQRVRDLSNSIIQNADSIDIAKAALRTFEEGLERLKLKEAENEVNGFANSLKGLILQRENELELIGKTEKEQARILALRKIASLNITVQSDELKKLAKTFEELTIKVIENTEAFERDERQKAARKSLDAFIDNLEFEIKLLRSEKEVREGLIAVRKAELILEAEGLKLKDKRKDQILDLVDTLNQLKAAEEKKPKVQVQRLSIAETAERDIDKLFESIKFEKELIGLTNQEREKAIALRELEGLAAAAGRDDIVQLTAALEDELDQLLAFEEAQQVAQELGDSFADAFERIIFEGGNMRDALKEILLDIARISFRKNVTEPLAKNITKFIRPFVSSLIGAGGGVPSGSTGALGVTPRLQDVFNATRPTGSGADAFPINRIAAQSSIAPLRQSSIPTFSTEQAGGSATTINATLNISGVQNPEDFRQSRSQVTNGLRNIIEKASEQR